MKIIDMHCDTISQIWNSRLRGKPLSLRSSGLMLDLEKMKKGGYLLQNFAVFTNLRLPEDFDGNGTALLSGDSSADSRGRYMDPWHAAKEMIRVFHEEIAANSDLIGQVRTYGDIEENSRKGIMCGLLTVEEGGILQGDISRLADLYREGVRMMTLTWNYENELGYPNHPLPGFRKDFRKFFAFVPEKGNGLKKAGFEALHEMERLGIIPDVSHLSDEGFYDVARTVRGPFVASHSNARSITGCGRNLTDDMIRTIAEHGGVTGLNFCQDFVSESPGRDMSVSSLQGLCRHARHIMNVGGREVLGLGTDFDGILPGRLDIENASRMQRLCGYMEAHGFTQEEIEGIFYKNVLRVYKEIL